MKSIRFWELVVVGVIGGFCGPLAVAQGGNPLQDSHTKGTTLGESQNSAQDLANSLVVPNHVHIGKEKKEEVDPKKLVSKKSNDTTFSGSLNDIGLDWSGNKMGKPRAGAETDSKSAKQPESVTDKNSKAANSSQSAESSQTKESKSTSSKRDEKSPEKEKTSDDSHQH